MNKAKQGDTVHVHYIARTNDEIIFDSSKQQSPAIIKIGKKEVIPDFEDALIGMSRGEKKQISVGAERAFGPYVAELVQTVDKKHLPKNIELKEGQRLEIPQPDGNHLILTVKKVTSNEVILDANHPLAGKDLIFEIEMIDIV